ncbi:MAG: ACT domain-containing protein [Thermoplasmata archaeon]|nr:ACT domain-containing protein [Thermoplasmata archaeon]
MKEFDVFVQDKPGELAKVCELLGNNGVNIKGIASERNNSRPLIRVVTDDEATAKAALTRSGIGFDLREVIPIRLPDKPGELGKVAKKLARAMVNVDSIFILGKDGGHTEMVLTVDNKKKAEEALK